MADNFDTARNRDELGNPARQSAAVTPHATNALTDVPQALFIGTGGDLVCRLQGDSSDRTFKNLPDGSTLAIRVTHVRDTSTAADIVALY